MTFSGTRARKVLGHKRVSGPTLDGIILGTDCNYQIKPSVKEMENDMMI